MSSGRDEYVIAKGVYTPQGITRFLECSGCGESIVFKRDQHTWFPTIPHTCNAYIFHSIVTS